MMFIQRDGWVTWAYLFKDNHTNKLKRISNSKNKLPAKYFQLKKESLISENKPSIMLYEIVCNITYKYNYYKLY